MRKSLLMVGASLVLAAGTTMAQIPTDLTNSPAWKPSNAQIQQALQDAPVPTRALVKKEGPSAQLLEQSPLYRTDFYPSFETYTTNRVLQYEPKSGILYFVRNNRIFDQTSGNLTGGQVRLIYSTDMGSTWSETEIINRSGTVMSMPNLGIVNPTGGTTAEDPMWGILMFTYDETANWARTSQAGIFKTSGEPFDFLMDGPDVGNNSGFTWNYGDMVSSDADAATIHFAGLLSNAGGGQYGTYGQWGFDFNVEDFTASSIPTQWDVNQFRNPGTLNSSYNGGARIGADADGKLYMVANNMFADDQDNRVPAVSMSEDLGASWSTFERMPVSAYDAYAATHGLPNAFVYSPYDQEALVVTGTNQFSYFFRVAATNAQNQLTNLDLVEATYNNGTWTLTRIAELSGIPLEFTRQDSISNLQAQYAWIPSYSASSLGHEIEVARTADGSGMVVKWIDENQNRRFGFPTQNAWRYAQTSPGVYQWVEVQFDTIAATDVFFSYKMIGSGQWSTPVNISDDDNYDHGTRIPPIIPDLEHVPMLSLKTIEKSEYNQTYPYLPAIQNIPDIMLDAHVDYRTPNTVQYSMFDAINPASVNEVENYSFRFNSLTPNPAQDNAEVVFTMDNAGVATVELFSTTGNHVSTVFNGMLGAGIHGMNVNASEFASGTYYVTLSVGAHRVTMPLVIVR